MQQHGFLLAVVQALPGDDASGMLRDKGRQGVTGVTLFWWFLVARAVLFLVLFGVLAR